MSKCNHIYCKRGVYICDIYPHTWKSVYVHVNMYIHTRDSACMYVNIHTPRALSVQMCKCVYTLTPTHRLRMPRCNYIYCKLGVHICNVYPHTCRLGVSFPAQNVECFENVRDKSNSLDDREHGCPILSQPEGTECAS